MAAVKEQAVVKMAQARVEVQEIGGEQHRLDFGVLGREDLVQRPVHQILVDVLLAGIAVPQIQAQAELVIGVLRQILGAVRLHGGEVIRVVLHGVVRLDQPQEILDVDFLAHIDDPVAAGAGKDVGQGGQRRVNAGVVAAQMDVIIRKRNGLGRRLFGLRDVARFGKGVVRVVAAGFREQEVMGGLDKALHVVDHDGVLIHVKDGPVTEEVGDRVDAAVFGEAHALGDVGSRQIEPVVEVRDAHVGHVGQILIEADGRGLGAVHLVPHDGQVFFRIALREGRDAERQHHREREEDA